MVFKQASKLDWIYGIEMMEYQPFLLHMDVASRMVSTCE